MENSLKPSSLEIRASRLKWAKRITSGLDRGVNSLTQLYLRLDSEWEERFKLNWELYRFQPPLLLVENSLELDELQSILGIFTEWEEYEWCLVANRVLQYYGEAFYQLSMRF